MMAWTSPGLISRLTPFRISVPSSICACRFLTFNMFCKFGFKPLGILNPCPVHFILFCDSILWFFLIQPSLRVKFLIVFLPPQQSEEYTSELQSRPHLVCRLLLEKKKKKKKKNKLNNYKNIHFN